MDTFERLVIVNRDNPPDPIDIRIPLDRVLDRQWAVGISKAILGEKEWRIEQATSQLTDQLPDKPGLYMFVWRSPFPMPSTADHNHCFRTVLYVGRAGGPDSHNTIRTRYKQEYADMIEASPESIWNRNVTGRKARMRRLLNLRDLEYWYHEVTPLEHIPQFEEILIHVFNPPGNIVHATSSRVSTVTAKLVSPIPAF